MCDVPLCLQLVKDGNFNLGILGIRYAIMTDAGPVCGTMQTWKLVAK